MDNERRKKLLETMKGFNKDQKEPVLDFGSNRDDFEFIPTGIKTIDDFLGGGTKRGTFTIFWGGYSVGKTSLVLQEIGKAQKEGKICCYINLEKPIDKSRFETFGVNLDDLVLANHTKNAEQALEIIRRLCKEKVVDLIVLDSLNAMAPKGELEGKGGKERALEEKNIAELARVMSEFCRKVNPDIYNAKASVVIIGQVRLGNIGGWGGGFATLSGGEAIKFYSYNIVYMRKGANSDAPVSKFKKYFLDKDKKVRYKTEDEEIGFDVVLRLDKTNSSKGAKEKSQIHIPFLYNKGFVDEIIQDEEIPIVIKADSDEDREIIEKELKEKGIKPLSAQDEPTVLMGDKIKDENPHCTEENLKESIETSTEISADHKVKEEPKKKKRGRPKKKKDD